MKSRLTLIITSILLALLFCSTASAVPIESYYSDSDGNDYSPAFEKALAASEPVIDLRFKEYNLTRTIDVCTPLSIRGVGNGNIYYSSAIYTQRKTAFKTYPKGKCPRPNTNPVLAGSLSIEHITIANRGGQWRTGEPPFFGIEVNAVSHVSDFAISGFINGIRIDCGIAAGTGDCSRSTFFNGRIDLSEHAGVYIRGGDASVINFTSVASDRNCRYPLPWNADAIAGVCSREPKNQICSDQHFHCAGFFDTGFLGNVYVGTIVHNENGYAGYVIANANARTSCTGCYAESDTGSSYGHQWVNVFGGANVFVGPAGQIHGAEVPGLVFKGNGTEFRLGSSAGTGVLWSAAVPTIKEVMAHPWRMKIDAATGDLKLDVGNLLPLRGYAPWRATP